jgi:hypothetical protein
MYYTDLFSPETYEAFQRSGRSISGFRKRQLGEAKRINPGDKLVCYMTKLSRWIGLLEIESPCYIDDSPLFYPEDDPFVVRFKVRVVSWLPREKTVPIHDESVWNTLSFTRGVESTSSAWTGKLRKSLNKLSAEDGAFLERLLVAQEADGTVYPVNEERFRSLVTQRIRRSDKVVAVTVPQDEPAPPPSEDAGGAIRESSQMQALLARCGEKMGYRVWIPKNDRSSVLQEWRPEEGSLIESLPLNYDDTTLRTIEQIDVLWLKGRSIMRAFEVEHTTAIYSGLLRMADLLALQPNMDIRLHIVAPEERRDKVFTEIRRPVFSLLEKAPLSDCCTFLSYESIRDLSQQKHLEHMADSVLQEYEEESE